MCGIFIYLKKLSYASKITKGQLYESFMKMKHRGPDRSSFLELSDYGVCLGFHRLAIMDTSNRGDQPFTYEDEKRQIYLLCNGEIYNFKELSKKYQIELKSGSDCEILLPLFLQIGLDAMIKELLGEFSFCICEVWKETKEVKLYVGRDQLGIRPLVVTGDSNEIVLCSELMGSPYLFSETEYFVDQFKPRNYLEVSSFDEGLCIEDKLKYVEWLNFRNIPVTIYNIEEAKKALKQSFEEGVDLMMKGDRELCCFLSGGIDSSLVSSRVSQQYKKIGKKLKTFSIGLDTGSTDEYFAKLVAEYIGSEHTHVTFTEQEFLDSVEEVIRILGSYDITTIRATCGQFLLAKWVSKNTNIKIIKGGDVSDEVSQGYVYFKKSPNSISSRSESISLLENIHFFDVKRGDRGIASNGMEARLPFGYKKFLTTVLSIDPELVRPRNGVEKWLIRETFKNENYLPQEVIKREKEAFSDAISTVKRSWYQILQEYINTKYSNEELENAKKRYNHLPPVSKESMHYRLIFEKYYGVNQSTAKILKKFWLPNSEWCGNILEPSARVLDVYNE